MRYAIAAALMASISPTLATAQAPQQAPPPAPNTMSRQALRDEVTQQRAIIQGRAVRPQRPEGCVSPESRQFDFWVGEWDVSPSGSTLGVTVAESSITLTDQGCVIIEHWRPFGGGHGHSINIYDPIDKKWHQTWADANGTRTEYSGAIDSENVLRLDNLGPVAQDQSPGRRRMNFRRIDERTVRQWGEVFDDATQAWTVEWDFTYRRRAGTR